LFLLYASSASAEKRVALVLGNSAYQNVTRLDNPRNDAALMAETLSGLGFTLVGGFDGAILSLGWKEALWDKFFTAAPRRQRRSVERYNIVKRA